MDQMQAVFESVARYFSVLGEPTRLRLLHALCQDERCVNDLIKATGLTQANASRHLGLMYQAGMLSRRRDGTQIFYKLADPMYVELCRTVSVQVNGRTVAACTTRAETGQQVHSNTEAINAQRKTLLHCIHLTDSRRSCSLKLCTCLLKFETRSLSAAFSRCISPDIFRHSAKAFSQSSSLCE